MKNILYAVFRHSRAKNIKVQVSIGNKHIANSYDKTKQTKSKVSHVVKGILLILKKTINRTSPSKIPKPYPQCFSILGLATYNMMRYQIISV